MLIFNLSINLSQKELLELFRSYGKVIKMKSFYIPWKMKFFNCKVWFESAECCQKAVLELNKAELDGLVLNVIVN